jgi:glycerol-3-phosphate dehydrogenase
LYLIGTTDIAETGDPGQVRISAAEVAYLCAETAQLFDTARWPFRKCLICPQ